MTQSENTRRLADEGVAIWLDDLSRDLLASGGLDRLVREKGVVGVTSNPTIFAKAVRAGDAYDGQLADLARRGVGAEEAARLLTAYDVRWGCDLLRPVYEETDRLDGRVSLECDPRVAHDTEATLAEARTLWWLVDRPNMYVKIPATPEGLPAISAALAEGISVNVTLIFSLERYQQVIEAHMTGLERAREQGRDLSSLGSVASFFVSRVDAEADRRLDKLGTPEAQVLRGRTAIANARLAYQLFERALATARWPAPASAGARPQRPLWASTGVKDPSYPDTRYVDELVAPGVVSTMPGPTLEAVADHARLLGDTVRGGYEEAQQTLDDLAAAGVSYDDVVRVLESDGVDRFAASWQEFLQTIGGKL
jgi:transaldolase